MAHPETVCQHQVFSFQNMLYLAFPPLINTMGQPAYNPGEGQNVHRSSICFKLAESAEG